MPSPFSALGLFGTVEGTWVELTSQPSEWTWNTVEANLATCAERHGLPLVFIGDSGSEATLVAHVLDENGYAFEFAGYSLHPTEREWPWTRPTNEGEPSRRQQLTGKFVEALANLDDEASLALATTVSAALPVDSEDDRAVVHHKLVQVLSALRQQLRSTEDELEQALRLRTVAQMLTNMLLGEPDDESPEEDQAEAEELRDPLEYGTRARVETTSPTRDDALLEQLPEAERNDGALEFVAEFTDVDAMRGALQALMGSVQATAHFVAELHRPWVQYLVTATPGRVVARRIYVSFDLPPAQRAWQHFECEAPDEVVVEG